MKEEKYGRMLERAKRLMALAKDPGASVNESAIAWEQAQKIMNEYAIEDWQSHRQERREDPIVEKKVDLYSDPMNELKAHLAGVVARGNRADAYSLSHRTAAGRKVIDSVVFCGTERDCLQAEMIWTSMETYLASHWSSAAQQEGIKPDAKWRNSYYTGFLIIVLLRYEKIRNEQEENEPAAGARNELVRVRGGQVADYMRNMDLGESEIPETMLDLDTAAFERGGLAAVHMALG